MEFIRHGDVLLKPVSEEVLKEVVKKGFSSSLGESLKKKYSGNSYTVAEGEVTGHSHVLTPKVEVLDREDQQLIDVYTSSDGKTYIIPHVLSKLTHQEHKEVDVLPGVYEVVQEQEHDYFSEDNRAVID